MTSYPTVTDNAKILDNVPATGEHMGEKFDECIDT